MPNCWAPSKWSVPRQHSNPEELEGSAKGRASACKSILQPDLPTRSGHQTRNQGSPTAHHSCTKCGHASYERAPQRKMRGERDERDERTGMKREEERSHLVCPMLGPRLLASISPAARLRRTEGGDEIYHLVQKCFEPLPPALARIQRKGRRSNYYNICTEVLLFIIYANPKQRK